MSTLMVRAELTQGEWTALRKLALDEGKPVKQIVGEELRRRLRESGYENKEE